MMARLMLTKARALRAVQPSTIIKYCPRPKHGIIAGRGLLPLMYPNSAEVAQPCGMQIIGTGRSTEAKMTLENLPVLSTARVYRL